MSQRQTMEELLDKCEEDKPITNPKEPIRTFFRKLAYRVAVWRNKHEHRGGRRPPSDETKDARK